MTTWTNWAGGLDVPLLGLGLSTQTGRGQPGLSLFRSPMTRWVRKVLAPGEAAITQPVSPALKRPSGSSGQREQQTTRVFCPWTCTQAGRHWQSGKYPWFLGTWTWTWTEVIDSRSRQLARRDSRRQQRLHRLGQIRSSRPCALPLSYANGMEQQCSRCVALQMPPAAPGISTSRGALQGGHSRAASSARGFVSIVSGCGLIRDAGCAFCRARQCSEVLSSAQHRAPRSGACPRRELQLGLRKPRVGREEEGFPR